MQQMFPLSEDLLYFVLVEKFLSPNKPYDFKASEYVNGAVFSSPIVFRKMVWDAFENWNGHFGKIGGSGFIRLGHGKGKSEV